jgi:glycosyltransferase involved in cell wall biosynthesis
MPNDEFVIFEPVDCRVAKWFDGLPNITAVTTPIPSEGRLRKFVARFWYWPSVLTRDAFDVFESLHLPLTRPSSGKALLTVHDIRSVRPGNSLFGRMLFKMVLSRSLKASDHVITVSEAMKEELLSLFPGITISVIYNGLDVNRFNNVSEHDLSSFQKKYNLPETYVLAVGHFERRKNYLRLVDAIALLRDWGIVCPLLIIGNDSGERSAVEARVSAANLSDSVKILSGLTDHEVCCAYKLCGLFVMPSSYEGFGIPVLEAMAAHRPMVLSDLPVFREITQNQGIYFPHDDVNQMAKAIKDGLSSSEECSRVVEFSTERVEYFGFPNLAAQIEFLYRDME